MIIRVKEAAKGTAVEEGGSGHFLAEMSMQGAASQLPSAGGRVEAGSGDEARLGRVLFGCWKETR